MEFLELAVCFEGLQRGAHFIGELRVGFRRHHGELVGRGDRLEMNRVFGNRAVARADVVGDGLVVDNGVGVARKHVENSVASTRKRCDFGAFDLFGVGH